MIAGPAIAAHQADAASGQARALLSDPAASLRYLDRAPGDGASLPTDAQEQARALLGGRPFASERSAPPPQPSEREVSADSAAGRADPAETARRLIGGSGR